MTVALDIVLETGETLPDVMEWASQRGIPYESGAPRGFWGGSTRRFTFKTAADAIAFKLRWSDEFEIVEVV
ncbi:hypothetical protein ACFODL_15435 [Phenylobacterium terrae]|uniref:Uncharacterized protein n=1 Tax=Phenylobacterium terrae TaxID=2665495 RepID=A0ABW4N7C5_9CAUL